MIWAHHSEQLIVTFYSLQEARQDPQGFSRRATLSSEPPSNTQHSQQPTWNATSLGHGASTIL